MPDVARKRVSFSSETIAPRQETAPVDGVAPPETGSGSSAAILPLPRPARFRGIAALSMARLDRAMRSVSVRRLVGVLGAVVALMTALAYPVGYGVIGYWKVAALLSFKADLAAARATGFILEHGLEYGASWRSHAGQLAGATDVSSPNSSPLPNSRRKSPAL